MAKVKTVITIELSTDVQTFESKEFQEVINDIKTGALKRDLEDNNKLKVKAACTHWTNYKNVKKEIGNG